MPFHDCSIEQTNLLIRRKIATDVFYVDEHDVFKPSVSITRSIGNLVVRNRLISIVALVPGGKGLK